MMDNIPPSNPEVREPIPLLEELYTGLGSLCRAHGTEAVHEGDGSHSFVIADHPVLRAAGIEEVTFVAPFFDEGMQMGNRVYISFNDPELDRGLSIWESDDGYAADSYADPKQQAEGERPVPNLGDDAEFQAAAQMLFDGQISDNPEIRAIQLRLAEYLSIQDSSSADPEDIAQAARAYRGLREFFGEVNNS